MMKKLTILPLAVFLLLTGCTPHNNDLVTVAKNTDKTGSVLIKETRTKVDELVAENVSFILTTYADEGCSCWVGFYNSVLIPYVNDFYVDIYALKGSLLDDDKLNIPYDLTAGSNVIFAIFEEGTYKYGVADFEEETMFHNYKTFKNWMERHIIVV